MTRTFNLLTIQIERCGVGNTNRKEGVTFFEHATLGTSLNDVIHARGVGEHLHDRGGFQISVTLLLNGLLTSNKFCKISDELIS